MERFSEVASNLIICGPVLNWLELDNRGHRLLVPDNDNCPINTPAVAAAYSVKRYIAQAPDEISFEVKLIVTSFDYKLFKNVLFFFVGLLLISFC